MTDSITGDSVRWINTQIRQWEEAIMLNEWEKVNIDNVGLRKKLKEIELTKLYKKYEPFIVPYNLLVTASSVASLGLLAAGILPSIATGVTFGVMSVAKVAELELQNKILEYIGQRQLLIDRYSQTLSNYSISSGITYTSSTSHNIAKSEKHTVNFSSSFDWTSSNDNLYNNMGTGMNKGTKLTFENESTTALNSVANRKLPS